MKQTQTILYRWRDQIGFFTVEFLLSTDGNKFFIDVYPTFSKLPSATFKYFLIEKTKKGIIIHIAYENAMNIFTSDNKVISAMLDYVGIKHSKNQELTEKEDIAKFLLFFDVVYVK